ncbi:hypothetical protein HPB49_009844 [Dermacentor silvarum]|uniref:Uncharacterized protein n=1 Tax=Dermacentor silvarum TaxID=543639 RepID=A0ACB8C2W9_DERSI|nr:hypothetical protein HPB49_009844 [Dermacentor silvarum]
MIDRYTGAVQATPLRSALLAVAIRRIMANEKVPTRKNKRYHTYTDVTNNTLHRTATLVSKHITVIERTLQSSSISHVLLELVPCSRSDRSLYVLNIYSAPNARQDDFGYLFAQLCKHGKHILIAGDFNASHVAWGYATGTPKAADLLKFSQFIA